MSHAFCFAIIIIINTMLVKRNATLNYEFFVAPLNEWAQL